MATPVDSILRSVRMHLIEPQPKFWGDEELIDLINRGVHDLWRDIADLKQEHFLTIDNTNVSLAVNTATLSGVPADVHKVFMIEPRTLTGSNVGLIFTPKPYNDPDFQAARGADNIDPSNAQIFYAIHTQGGPVAAPTIQIAPKVTVAVNISFAYVPVLAKLSSESVIPIPGEADNAIIAWTIAFARAKERQDQAPDTQWLAIYATEKAHLLQSLGIREYQDPEYTSAVFGQYW